MDPQTHIILELERRGEPLPQQVKDALYELRQRGEIPHLDTGPVVNTDPTAVLPEGLATGHPLTDFGTRLAANAVQGVGSYVSDVKDLALKQLTSQLPRASPLRASVESEAAQSAAAEPALEATPGGAIGRSVIPAIGSMLVAPEAGAKNALDALMLGTRAMGASLGRGLVQGGAFGAMTPAPSSTAYAKNIGLDALIGGGTTLGLNAVLRAAGGAAPEVKEMFVRARDAGVPISAGAALKEVHPSQQALTKVMSEESGLYDPDTADGYSRVPAKLLEQHDEELGRRFMMTFQGKKVNFDPIDQKELTDSIASLPTVEAPGTPSFVKKVSTLKQYPIVDGEDFAASRREVSSAMYKAFKANNYAVGNAYGQVLDTMDRVAARTLTPEEQADFATLRYNWSNFAPMRESMAADLTGTVDPRQLTRVLQARNPTAFAQETGNNSRAATAVKAANQQMGFDLEPVGDVASTRIPGARWLGAPYRYLMDSPMSNAMVTGILPDSVTRLARIMAAPVPFYLEGRNQ